MRSKTNALWLPLASFIALLSMLVMMVNKYNHHKSDHTKWPSTSLIDQHQASLVLTVDLKGGANFSTVQQAIDFVPNSSPSKTLILIRSGTYREKVVIPANKSNLIIQGESFSNTAIEWNDTAKSANGTFNSPSVAIFASNFTAYNISFKNTAPEPSPGDHDKQAVALRISGDQAAFYDCGFYGAQDTLLDESGRHYFKECFIQGSIDFIFGNARSLYQGCVIHSTANEVTSGISGSITAHGRESMEDQTGFSFVNCIIQGTGGYGSEGLGNLMPLSFSPELPCPRLCLLTDGMTWETPLETRPGANNTLRSSYAKQLTENEAAVYMSISYIDGEKWIEEKLMPRFEDRIQDKTKPRYDL